MQNELEDQAFLLDDLGREMDTTESRLGAVTKKITKVLHMSSGKGFRKIFINIFFRPWS